MPLNVQKNMLYYTHVSIVVEQFDLQQMQYQVKWW